jgi:hypothetical protein
VLVTVGKRSEPTSLVFNHTFTVFSHSKEVVLLCFHMGQPILCHTQNNKQQKYMGVRKNTEGRRYLMLDGESLNVVKAERYNAPVY